MLSDKEMDNLIRPENGKVKLKRVKLDKDKIYSLVSEVFR
jgi:hypothetical protein